MYKKARCTCRVVVLLIQPIAFLTFLLSSPSWHLKVFLCSCAIQGPVLNLTLCKRGIWFLESGKFLLVEFGILGFRIQNTAQESGIALGIQNPSSTDKRWNRVPGIRNPWRGFQNPRLSRIPLLWGDQSY